jgi:hypothetical protein
MRIPDGLTPKIHDAYGSCAAQNVMNFLSHLPDNSIDFDNDEYTNGILAGLKVFLTIQGHGDVTPIVETVIVAFENDDFDNSDLPGSRGLDG